MNDQQQPGQFAPPNTPVQQPLLPTLRETPETPNLIPPLIPFLSVNETPIATGANSLVGVRSRGSSLSRTSPTDSLANGPDHLEMCESFGSSFSDEGPKFEQLMQQHEARRHLRRASSDLEHAMKAGIGSASLSCAKSTSSTPLTAQNLALHNCMEGPK